jgi:uncharacterized membrane protein YagU involved in acid resistance
MQIFPKNLNSPPKFSFGRAARTILLAGFVAGTLDIIGAMVVYCYILKALTPIQLLEGIAAGLFGNNASTHDNVMAFVGLGFHYGIALCFAKVYFFAYLYIPFLRRHRISSGLLYGVFVWLVMNLIVLPLSNAHHYPFDLVSALIAVIILILCIGLPISIVTNHYYHNANKKEAKQRY